MLKKYLISIAIFTSMATAPAYAIQASDCRNDPFTSPKINKATKYAAIGTETNQIGAYLYAFENSPFEGMSVETMKPANDQNCIHTYLKLTDKNGKDVEIVVSYPNSRSKPDKAVNYVDIGEWKIISNYTELRVSKGSALVFNPADENKKRFVLQRNVAEN